MNIASDILQGKSHWVRNRPQLENTALGKAKFACENNVLCLGLDRAFVKLRPPSHVWDIQGSCYGFLYEGDASEGIALQKCTNKVEGVARVIMAVVIPEANKSYTVMESFAFRTYPMTFVGFQYITPQLRDHSMRTFIQAAKVLQALSGCGTKFKVTSPFAWINSFGEILVLPSSFAPKEDTTAKDPQEVLLHLARCYGAKLKEIIEGCNPSDFWALVIDTLEKMYEEELQNHFLGPLLDEKVDELINSVPTNLIRATQVAIGHPGESIQGHPNWSVKRLPNRGQVSERLLFRGPLIGQGCYKNVFSGVLYENEKAYKVAVSVFNRTRGKNSVDNELAGNSAGGYDHLLSIWEARFAMNLYEQIAVLHQGTFANCLERPLLSFENCIEIMRQASIGLANFQQLLGRIYMDFKADNILVDRNKDGSFYAVLADLGGSGEPGDHNLGTATPLFASPDRFEASSKMTKLTHATDVWSFGATLLFVATGITLETENLKQIHNGQLKYMDSWIQEVAELRATLPKDKIGVLIRTCLSSAPELRPSVYDLEKLIREG